MRPAHCKAEHLSSPTNALQRFIVHSYRLVALSREDVTVVTQPATHMLVFAKISPT
jgi:hypothetical protein